MSAAEESESQQLARNLNELLQEIRVAQAGVQILFGFLLSITFMDRYATASGLVKTIHLVTVLFATAAVLLLTGPAAWHRILFRQGRRERIIGVADKLAIAGLVCLAVAMSLTVLLIFEMVVGGVLPMVLAAVTLVSFVGVWFARPLHERSRGPAPDRAERE
ncbi:MAG TPA: DUF6328 family protein [Actinophytocola sp.]|uniref:DUF6328 family protein n=1 Tax=Actinophytocola sp. TaxID=1872138 RepID=UPI002DB6D610|nr:DUF6328 family protein [Actinophytocola sp.]HEU5473837.1 DUF6328 family protein [Actinophytocola sp.]